MTSPSLLWLLVGCGLFPDFSFDYALDPDNDGFPWDTMSQDCDHGDPTRHPGASELCNGVDDDCDGGVDEGESGSFYKDLDSDGFGDPNAPASLCEGPQDGVVEDSSDCDDADARVHPGAFEICEPGVDGDCDGSFGCALGQLGHISTDDADAKFIGAMDQRLGVSIGAAGDSNQDSRTEFVLGAQPLMQVTGRVAWVKDSRIDGTLDDDWEGGEYFDSATSGWTFGYSVHVGMDILGDGQPDLVVGAPNAINTMGDNGAVFVFEPAYGDHDAKSVTIFVSDEDKAQDVGGLGGTAIASGSVGGTGEAVLAIGVPLMNDTKAAGAILLIEAKEIQRPNTVLYTKHLSPVQITHDTPGEYLGESLALVENFYSDGRTALLAGGEGGHGSNKARVILMPVPTESAISSEVAVSLYTDTPEPVPGEVYPVWLEGAGDLDGDGYADALATAATPTGVAVWLLTEPNTTGTTGKLDDQDRRLFFDQDAAAVSPRASVEDLDGDGAPDLVVTSESEDQIVLYVFYSFGTAEDVLTPEDAEASIVMEGSKADTVVAVAGVGDSNGDSYSDLLIGCSVCYGEDRGVAWLFYGGR